MKSGILNINEISGQLKITDPNSTMNVADAIKSFDTLNAYLNADLNDAKRVQSVIEEFQTNLGTDCVTDYCNKIFGISATDISKYFELSSVVSLIRLFWLEVYAKHEPIIANKKKYYNDIFKSRIDNRIPVALVANDIYQAMIQNNTNSIDVSDKAIKGSFNKHNYMTPDDLLEVKIKQIIQILETWGVTCIHCKGILKCFK
jgi:hypothetical protein